MGEISKNRILDGLKKFENFGEKIKTPTEAELERIFLRNNKYIAIIGYKTLTDFARFTSHEDLSIDTIDYNGKTRIYLTGLKRRAVYRRSSEAILREFNPDYSCATPDHQCMECYNCYTYGGVIAIKNKTKAIKSRVKPVTSFSIQSDIESIIDEPEFHNIVHRDLKMEQTPEQKKASLYELTLIKPGVVFSFVDIIFNPTRFDISMYLETLRRADSEGYGSRSSLLGTMKSKIVAITDEMKISQKDLLDTIMVENGIIDDSRLLDIFNESEKVSEEELEKIRMELPSLINEYKNEIFGLKK